MWFLWFVFYIALVLIILKVYVKLTTGWCRSQTCLVGKTAIVTGANTGIGYETAIDFAKRGARTILACRNEEKAKDACKKIIKETGNENVFYKLLDTSSLKSVRSFADGIIKSEKQLDILVNNAGVGALRNSFTEDGLQILMQVNYFGPFLLTNLLLDLLKKSGPSRIVNVSSVAAKFGYPLDIDHINKFSTNIDQYQKSKLCNILFTIELARLLRDTQVTTYSLHPGVVKTEIFRTMPPLMQNVTLGIINLFFKTSTEGAQTTIYLSVQKGIEEYTGEHFEDCHVTKRYETAKDPKLAKKLWERTEKILKLK